MQVKNKSAVFPNILSQLPAEQRITKYYIDCQNGDDQENGKSINTAWKSFRNISTTELKSGNQLLLKSSCTWYENIHLNYKGRKDSYIKVGAYGEGDKPVISTSGNSAITITGSYLNINNISIKVNSNSTELACENNPKGEISGIRLEAGASNNILQHIQISGAYAGIFIDTNSNHNIIRNNTLENNKMMVYGGGSDDDHGAFGILIWGDDNIIEYNKMEKNDACSYDYVRDGSAVEIYGGKRNIIRYNQGVDNDSFVELGNSRSTDTTIAYNLVQSDLSESKFLVTRGAANFGPVYNTNLYNNTVYLTGERSQGIVCIACYEQGILNVKNNIIWSNFYSIRVEGQIIEDHNIYWGGRYNITLSPTSMYADPLFISPDTFRLQENSPAIGKGVSIKGFEFDLLGIKLYPQVNPDIGAYEF